MPSRDFTSEDLFSSRMISMHSSTHSSQMNTVGPAISLRTSCWLLPQNEQRSVFLESLPPALLISELRQDASQPRASLGSCQASSGACAPTPNVLVDGIGGLLGHLA